MITKPSTFVINLKRRPERLKFFLDNTPLKDVNIEYGFDGKNIENEDINEQNLLQKFINFLPGEKGCFISHLRIWNHIVNNNIEYALIFEDDAILCDGFLEKYNHFINNIPNDCDIAFIGGRFESNYKMDVNNYIEISENVIQHKNITEEYYYDFCRTTHSYILSKKTAKLLIRKFDESEIVTTALDHWMLQNLNYLNSNIKIYESMPLLCHSPFISDSDIR
jgi:GR25 family glycosyltransferase involved in LPS biosynthesis